MGRLQVEFPRSGDILSRHDGEETDAGLRLTVRGAAPGAQVVRVDGCEAPVRDGRFEAPLLLTDAKQEVTVSAGGETRRLVLLYDRRSFPRWRFSVDDVIWCFTEVARHTDRYPSLFDHWFFAFFRKLHRDFDAQVQMNIYFQDPESHFDLTQFPDRYRGEWRDNADWLRLSFHALDNNCYDNRIYRDTTEEQLRADCEKVTEQIVRFAGEETLCRTYTTLHWAETNPAGARALRRCGVLGLTGRFGVDRRGRPFSTAYHLDEGTNRRLHGRNLWYDPATDLYFVNCPQFLNNVPVGLIAWHYDRLVEGKGGRAPFDVIDFLVHEEHFWRGYAAYKPDNMERCITAGLWAAERGLEPVCFGNGLAGN